jgi:hypothetical protein
MKTTKPNQRRKFLLAASLGGAGAAAAVVAGSKGAKQGAAVADASAKPETTAYQATPHVLKYYKTTEV